MTMFSYSVVCVMLIILFGGCAVGQTKKSGDLLQQALSLYQAGKFNEAEQRWSQVHKTDPDNAAALEMLGVISLWKNDAKAALQFFEEAQSRKSWLGNLWPMNSQLKVRQAISYTRLNRYHEATSVLEKAAGPISFGPFKELKARAAQAALFENSVPNVISGADETHLDFVMLNPLPVVKIGINGTEPVNFIIDTGGEDLILDNTFAREVGAAIVGKTFEEYAGGKKGETHYGRIDSVALGEISIKNVAISTLDLSLISESVFEGVEIQGVIGTRILMRFFSTIDYRNKRLTLRRFSSGAADRVRKESVASAILNIPMWLVETHLIFVRGSFNQQPSQLFFIDTGLAGAGFLTSKSLLNKAGVAMDWSKAGIGPGGGGMVKGLSVSIDTVALGDEPNSLVKHNIDGVVFENDMSIFKGELGFTVGGLVSHQFFRDHTLSFDFENMRLIVQ